MEINRNVCINSEERSSAVRKALENLRRDITKVCTSTDRAGDIIRLERKATGVEQYELRVEQNASKQEELVLYAQDTLGFVYGIYEISRSLLGITDFWFWNDQEMTATEYRKVDADFHVCGKPYAVKLRGWFVNDEVLLHTWMVDREKDKPWEMVFEALLRCGGNMIIPGTDRNAEHYRRMASDMGLYITHHHAEPLGAPMFARVYPELTPSYAEHAGKFCELWDRGIEEQKGMKVIWNLGFRGQGDRPFWEDDPQYATPQSRGELMSKLIRFQYDKVKAHDAHARCCTNLYGETMELYRQGCLTLPEDVIKIWADNGFGKMVTRRQGNHNPRICALPAEGDTGSHGIYYHVSFYDLQAANHITMLPNSADFVIRELKQVLEKGMQDYWIINCSNVKPHVYFLDLIAQLWRYGDVEEAVHRNHYVETYYGTEQVADVAQCLTDYGTYALAYGSNPDDHAGEQFSNHVARILISQYMRNEKERAEELLWATDADTLAGQTDWYDKLCQQAQRQYATYLQQCERTAGKLQGNPKRFFADSILLQAKIHRECYTGALEVCQALQAAFAGDYKQAFYRAGLAREHYENGDTCLRSREHGKWHNFYQNECLTDIKQTAWVIQGWMSYLRNMEDGPHFYQWQREFLYSEEDRRVMLVLNMENHLTDQEIFQLMKEKWQA